MQQNEFNTPLNSTKRILVDQTKDRNESSIIEDMQNNCMIFKQQRQYLEQEEVAQFKTINQKHDTDINISEFQEDNLYQTKQQRNIFSIPVNEETIENYINKNQLISNLSSKQQCKDLPLLNNKEIKRLSQASQSSQSSDDDSQEDKITQPIPKGINQQSYLTIQQHQNRKINQILKKQFTNQMSYILPRIKKFFFNKTLSGKTQKLTKDMRRIIGDKADNQGRTANEGYFLYLIVQILNMIKKIGQKLYLSKIPIFNPENTLKIIFNIITVTFSCFYIFMITLKIFFLADLGKYDSYLHTLAEIVWVIEMLVQMNTAMYHKNQFTKDRRIIMKIYLKEYFFFEILPLIFENFKPQNEILHLLFKIPLILKIKGININLSYIEFFILQKLENHTVLFLLKLISSLLLFSHLIACSYSCVNAFNIYFYNEQTSWTLIYQSYLNNKDWFEHYLSSLNWALNIMYSNFNIQPTSKLEIAFTCLCMIVSCIGFGYIVSSIGSILSEIDKEQKQYKQDLNVLNQYMKRKQIDMQVLRIKQLQQSIFILNFRSLVRRVNIHLKKYYDQKRRVNYLEERNSLQKLNEYMSKELHIAANNKILKQFPLFSNIFSQQTILKICMIMQERLYSPNQVIFDSINNQEKDCNLYLIEKGQGYILYSTIH